MTGDWLSHGFRDALLAMVRRHVPERDAEDVVQTVLVEVLTSAHRPAEPDAARRWIRGVSRNKIVDYHRRSRREALEQPELSASVSDAALDDLLHWAQGELPADQDAQRTFAWLLREGEGEKLEDIARSEQLPPAQVRQRVSRMRRFFRERWALYAAALVALVVGLYVVLRGRSRPAGLQVVPSSEEVATRERARTLRAEALRECAESRWRECLRDLDRARAIDPSGEQVQAVSAARARAEAALRAPPPTSEAPVPPVEERAPVPAPPLPIETPTPTPRPSADADAGMPVTFPVPSFGTGSDFYNPLSGESSTGTRRRPRRGASTGSTRPPGLGGGSGP